jgi:phosphatidylserine synthase
MKTFFGISLILGAVALILNLPLLIGLEIGPAVRVLPAIALIWWGVRFVSSARRPKSAKAPSEAWVPALLLGGFVALVVIVVWLFVCFVKWDLVTSAAGLRFCTAVVILGALFGYVLGKFEDRSRGL